MKIHTKKSRSNRRNVTRNKRKTRNKRRTRNKMRTRRTRRSVSKKNKKQKGGILPKPFILYYDAVKGEQVVLPNEFDFGWQMGSGLVLPGMGNVNQITSVTIEDFKKFCSTRETLDGSELSNFLSSTDFCDFIVLNKDPNILHFGFSHGTILYRALLNKKLDQSGGMDVHEIDSKITEELNEFIKGGVRRTNLPSDLVMLAGEITFGKSISVSNKSGHFQTDPNELTRFFEGTANLTIQNVSVSNTDKEDYLKYENELNRILRGLYDQSLDIEYLSTVKSKYTIKSLSFININYFIIRDLCMINPSCFKFAQSTFRDKLLEDPKLAMHRTVFNQIIAEEKKKVDEEKKKVEKIRLEIKMKKIKDRQAWGKTEECLGTYIVEGNKIVHLMPTEARDKQNVNFTDFLINAINTHQSIYYTGPVLIDVVGAEFIIERGRGENYLQFENATLEGERGLLRRRPFDDTENAGWILERYCRKLTGEEIEEKKRIEEAKKTEEIEEKKRIEEAEKKRIEEAEKNGYEEI